MTSFGLVKCFEVGSLYAAIVEVFYGFCPSAGQHGERILPSEGSRMACGEKW